MAVLGIDTSCYRTSLALADERVLGQKRQLLSVKKGERGLRQSEGVFQHVQALGSLTRELMREAEDAPIDAVIAAARPRDVPGSYMPVFTVGCQFGMALAAALRVPFYETSHQAGHIRAAMVDCALPAHGFLAVHLSGGTTELVRVDESMQITLLGGSEDLHAGQFVDRTGVMLGLGFPAGPELEALAREGAALSKIKPTVRGLTVGFSGAEAQAKRMFEAGAQASDIAAESYSLIARTMAKWLAAGVKETGETDILMSGGVSASALLRELLPKRLEKLGCGARLHWARPELAGDNAAGVALLGAARYAKETKTEENHPDTEEA